MAATVDAATAAEIVLVWLVCLAGMLIDWGQR